MIKLIGKLGITAILLISTLVLAEEVKKKKKNKIDLGNVNINANLTDNLFHINDKFLVTADGNVKINASSTDNLFQINDRFIISGGGNVKINASSTDNLIQINDRFIISGDGNIKVNAGTIGNLFQLNNKFVVTANGNVGIGTISPSSALEVSGPVNVKGVLKLSGSNSGQVSFIAPADGGSTTYTLPTADGSDGQFLTTNGDGTLVWATLHLHRTVCPKGFNLIGTPDSSDAFCISTVQENASTWLGGIKNCYNKNIKSRLCSASEWAMSCVAEGPKNMTGHWEWVADSGSNYGRIIGLAGCDSFNGALIEASYPSRCCFR